MSLMRAALAVLLVLIVAPLVNLVLAVPPPEFVRAVTDPATIAAGGTSLFASLTATLVATLLGVPAGFALARQPGPIVAGAVALLSLPLALPPVAAGVALLGLFGARSAVGAALGAAGIGIIDTPLGAIAAEFFVAGSIVAIAATAAFAGVDVTLEEAARTLGAGPMRVLRTISLPLAAPGIVAGIALTWLRAIGEYGATSLVAYHPATLSIALVTALSADGVTRALALAEAIVLVVIVVLLAATLARRRLG